MYDVKNKCMMLDAKEKCAKIGRLMGDPNNHLHSSKGRIDVYIDSDVLLLLNLADGADYRCPL